MRYFVLACMGFIAAPSVVGQQLSCDDDSLYHQLDFWIGEWAVSDDEGKVSGHNLIEKILDGCAVSEHWTGAGGGQGISLFYVDNDTREWRQVWVTGSAKQPWGQKEKRLIYSEPGQLVIFQGSYLYQGAPLLDRTLLRKVTVDEVTQTIQVSTDGGQTWRTTFVGHYHRAENE